MVRTGISIAILAAAAMVLAIAPAPIIHTQAYQEIRVPDAPAGPATPGSASMVINRDWLFEINQAADISVYDHRHLTVAAGCDVNGDGYGDVLVGDHDYDFQYTRDDNGRAWLFYGSPTGLSATPARTFDPPYLNYYGFFGVSVACNLDVNNDGFDEVVIGMDNYESTYSDEGAVFVWYGAESGPTTAYNWMVRGGTTYAHFGVSVDSAGSVNDDDYDDLIVSSRDYSANQTLAYVWHGGASGLGTTNRAADWSARISPENGDLAHGIGDVNGDGWDDVMVGALLYDGALTNQGAVYVWYGSATGLGANGTAANADWIAYGGQAEARFGLAGDGVGDLNGDSWDDLAVGAYLYDDPDANEGAVFVWYGSASGLGDSGNPANADWYATSNCVSCILGYSVRPGGDINKDGFDDILVGAPNYTAPAGGGTLVNAGALFAWLGSAAGLGDPGTPANADFVGYGDQADGRLGYNDIAAGDVNGDGLSDLFGAAARWENGQTDEGAVFGYYHIPKVFVPLVMK